MPGGVDRPGAPALVIEIVPAGAKLTVPALLSRTPVAPLVLTGEVGDVERAGGGVELEAGLGARGAGVDDVDVVDRAAAGVAGGAGDAAAGALRVDVEAADGVAVVEVDDVGVVVGDRRPVGRRRRCAACRSRPTSVGGLADQLLVGLEVDAGGVAGGGVVAVEDEDRVAGGGCGLGLGERVERRRRRCRCCLASSLLTYQTQPVIAIVTRPVSVRSGGPAAFWSVTV